MNDVYGPLFFERVAAAIGAAKAAAAVRHSGFKGTIREILIRDLFRPLIPSTMGVASGQIVTSKNETSSQQDVVIYDRSIMPPVLFEESIGVFPIESVLATVEVKTKLTLQGLKSAYKSAKTIDRYRYTEGRLNEKTGKLRVGEEVKHAVAAIFALGSTLTEGDEIDRYNTLKPEVNSPIKIICVAGRGYWFYDSNNRWQLVLPTKEHQEVVLFIVGLLPLLSQIRATRGSPPLVDYVL